MSWRIQGLKSGLRVSKGGSGSRVQPSNVSCGSRPAGGSAGGSRVVTPDAPFSVDDLTADHVFYVQDGRREAREHRDVFSFYVSDGHGQTEALDVHIDIQVATGARRGTKMSCFDCFDSKYISSFKKKKEYVKHFISFLSIIW